MKTLRTLLVIAIVIFGSVATSFGQTGTSLTANAAAKVLTALTITETQALNFGTFGASTDARTVVVATNNARTGSTANLIASDGGKAAIFDIVGAASTAINFTIPTTGLTTLTRTSGSETMTITNSSGWTSTPSDLTSITTAIDGKAQVKLGATLGACRTLYYTKDLLSCNHEKIHWCR